MNDSYHSRRPSEDETKVQYLGNFVPMKHYFFFGEDFSAALMLFFMFFH